MGEDSIVATIILTAINRASGEIAAVGGELEGLGSKGQAAGGLLSSGWTKAALGVGALTAGVVAFSVNAASKFEDTILKVANNTHMTTQEMSAMRQQVLKMGAESPAPLSEIALGFERAADAGFRGKQGFDVVQAAMKAAVETGGKVPDVVDAVTLSLHNFDLPAKDSGRALGMMMTAAADAVMRLPDLANNMNKVSQVAGQMHMPLADLLGAYATLTLSTHDASKTQTELAGAFTHILQPTKATTTEIQALSKASGVDLHAAFQKVSSGNMSFIDFLKTVKGSLDKAHLSAGDTKAAIFSLFGGQRGGLAGLSLINDLKTLQKTTDDVRNHTSLVGDEWKRTLDSMGNQSKILGNNVQILGITVGDFLIPKITEAEKWVNTLASETESGKGPIADFGKAAYNAGTFISDNFVGPLISGVQKSKDFQQAVHELGGEFGGLGGALHDLIAPLGLFSSNSKDAHDKAQLLATVLRDAATVIKDIFVAAVQASMLVIGIFKDSVKLAAGVVGDAIHAIVQAVQDMGTIFQSEFQLISDLVHGNFGKIWSDIQNVGHNIETFWADLWHNAYTLISNFAKNVANLVEDFVKHIVQFFEGLYHDLVGGSIIPDMITAIIAWFGKLPGAVFGIIAGLVASTVGQFASMSSQVLGKMAGFVSSLIADAGRAAAGFANGFRAIIGDAVGIIHTMVADVLGAVSGLAGSLLSAGANAAGSFASGLASGIGKVAGAAGSLLGAAAGLLGFHSPPPDAPWADPEVWGANVGKNFAVGLLSTIPLVANAASQVLRAVATVGSASVHIGASGQQAIKQSGSFGDSTASGFKELVTALNKLPSDFHAAAQNILNSYTSQIKTLNADHQAKLSSIHQKYLQGVATATEKSNQQLGNELSKFGISQDAQHKSWLNAMKQHEDTYLAKHDALERKINDDKTAKQVAADKSSLAALDNANSKWLHAEESSHGITTDKQRQMLEQWIKNHHASLEDTLKHLQTVQANNVTAEQKAYQAHVDKLKAALAKVAEPAGLWDQLTKEVNQLAGNTFKALELAILEGKGNVDKLAKSAAAAAEKAQKMADASDQAAIKIDKLTHNYQDLWDKELAAKQKALNQAKAQYELDLLHGVATQKDIDAITAAQQALNAYTDAVTKADAVASAATTATTTNTVATTNATTAADAATQALDLLAAAGNQAAANQLAGTTTSSAATATPAVTMSGPYTDSSGQTYYLNGDGSKYYPNGQTTSLSASSGGTTGSITDNTVTPHPYNGDNGTLSQIASNTQTTADNSAAQTDLLKNQIADLQKQNSDLQAQLAAQAAAERVHEGLLLQLIHLSQQGLLSVTSGVTGNSYDIREMLGTTGAIANPG